jgi:hypothetical protein
MQMRPTRVLEVLVVLALASATAWASFVPEPTAPVSYEGQQVVRFDVRRAEDRAKIERWTSARGLDVWARHPEWIDVRLPRLVAAVEDVPLRVMSNDLQQDIDAERASVLVRRLLWLIYGIYHFLFYLFILFDFVFLFLVRRLQAER